MNDPTASPRRGRRTKKKEKRPALRTYLGGGQPLDWRCRACGKRRPDELTAVAAGDIRDGEGNTRTRFTACYCADDPICAASAVVIIGEWLTWWRVTVHRDGR